MSARILAAILGLIAIITGSIVQNSLIWTVGLLLLLSGVIVVLRKATRL